MRRLVLLVGMLVAAASAARVSLADEGLSVDVPDGWKLTQNAAADWQLEDTVLKDTAGTTVPRHAGIVQFQAFTGASASGAENWDIEDSYAWRLFLANHPCYGWVYRHDSTVVDGLFAMFVQGEWATCPDRTTDSVSASTYNSILMRSLAQGDVGWEMSVVSDTLDFQNGYFDYRAVLDSVHVDRSFLALGVAARAVRGSGGLLLHRLGTGWLITARDGSALTDVRVLDVAGRPTGRLRASAAGWIWDPTGASGAAWVRVSRSGQIATERIPVLR